MAESPKFLCLTSVSGRLVIGVTANSLSPTLPPYAYMYVCACYYNLNATVDLIGPGDQVYPEKHPIVLRNDRAHFNVIF